MNYNYKTQPRGKQGEILERTWSYTALAFLCRPGTGKTKLGLDTAGMNWLADRIDAMLVIAPEGVDRQWIEEGVPKHLSDDVPRVCGNYRSGMGKLAYEKLWRTMLRATPQYRTGTRMRRPLIILTMTFDGLQTPRGKKLALELAKSMRVMCDLDESHKASNHRSAVHKAIKPVMRASRVKRISTGTLIRQNPFSCWGQFELMGDAMLGFSTLSSFKSMYAEMLPESNRLMQTLLRKVPTDPRTGKPRYIPQVQAKDDDGRPQYKNLRDLRRRLDEVAVFLTLKDVNGKEPVVNEDPIYVQLTSEQRRVYDDLVKYGVAQAPGGQLTAEGSLALSIRLAQVVGGHAPSDDESTAAKLPGANPKLEALLDKCDELGDEKLVIWCKFVPEQDTVTDALIEKYGADAVVCYNGRMTGSQKDAAKRAFIDHENVKFFVGQQKAGGTGLDGLQGVAHYMVFYSNDYPYLERLQAISRLARTDGADIVQVWDLIAEHTIDEDIVQCLKTAQDVSEAVLQRAIVREWD